MSMLRRLSNEHTTDTCGGPQLNWRGLSQDAIWSLRPTIPD
jgi:hypothetical protein